MSELSGDESPAQAELEARRSLSAPYYPVDLERDVTTKLGTQVHLRPIRADDALALVAFHQHLSPESVYRRFFFAHPALSPGEVERFTCVDYVDRLALVATDNDLLVAVGRYERNPGTSEAEVAFVVTDEYQHHGIGTMLLGELAGAAWQNGITAFFASTLAENRDMLDIFLDSGFGVSTAFELGIVSVRFPIDPANVLQAGQIDPPSCDSG